MNIQSFIIENLLPIAIGLMVLWVAYRLLFTNSNRFQFNRFYLLTAMLFSPHEVKTIAAITAAKNVIFFILFLFFCY